MHTKLQRRPVDPQARRRTVRTGYNPIRIFKGGQNVLADGLLESFLLAEGSLSAQHELFRLGQYDPKDGAAREDHCTFDHVLQFAHIAGPVISDQCLHVFGRNSFDTLVHTQREL